MNKEKEKITYSGLYIFLVLINVACVLASNIIVVKTISIFGFVFAASNMVYPFTYIIGDILAEVYGYKKAKFSTWMSFLCNLIIVIFFAITIAIPGSSEFQYQSDLVHILGNTPRILVSAFLAFSVGSLANALVLSKLKVATKGKFLVLRTISSTIIGEGLDCLIFFPLAMYGTISNKALIEVMVSSFIFKVIFEVVFTPLVVLIIKRIKEFEKLDTFDN